MLWIQQGLMPALDCSSVWAHSPRVQVASPSGVAVPSWLLLSVSLGLVFGPWSGLIVWPGLLTLSFSDLSPVS